MKTLTREEALHCANIFNDYFGQFNRIDQYMRDQKMAQIETIPAPLPGMGSVSYTHLTLPTISSV